MTTTRSSERVNSDLDYEPVSFLRCHSRKNDAADVQTQVWMCLFEPDPKNPKQTTNVVATCGANSVSLLDCTTGDLITKYYAKDVREMFYTLAWAPTPEGINILVSGGARNSLHVMVPSQHTLVLLHAFGASKKKRMQRIQALLFHPDKANILFCGNSDGEVTMCALQIPVKDKKVLRCSVNVVKQFSAESEIFCLAFCSSTKMLLAGCNDGLRGWNISDMASAKFKLLTFKTPEPENCETKLVDSVEILKDGMVATKCALHGAIYVWNLVNAVKYAKTKELIMAPTHILRWSDTDNYFMYLGTHLDSGLLCCGDDEGALWLYRLSDLNVAPVGATPTVLQPARILPWPELTDGNTEKKRKLSLDVYDIVVDKVTINSSGKYIVAVTNKNMVCIWEKQGN